jgi:hypothetical protein
MFANEFFGNRDIAIGNIFGWNRPELFMLPRFAQERARGRTVYGVLALRATVLRTDFTVDSGTVPARASFIAYLAENTFIVSSVNAANRRFHQSGAGCERQERS